MQTAAHDADVATLVHDVRVLTTTISNLAQTIEENTTRGQTQTVIHKADGTGTLAGVCVACVVIVLGFIIMENRSFAKLQIEMESNKQETQNELRDAKAWNEVLRSKVAKIEAQQPQERKP